MMPAMLATGPQLTPLTQADAPAIVNSSEAPASTGHLDGPGTK
jgi:hypothetical protein